MRRGRASRGHRGLCEHGARVTQDFRVGPATSTRLVRSVRSTKDVAGQPQFLSVQHALFRRGSTRAARHGDHRNRRQLEWTWLLDCDRKWQCVLFRRCGELRLPGRPDGPIRGHGRDRAGRLLARDGGTGVVFSFGDAPSHGGAAISALSTPVVAMAATPMGRGRLACRLRREGIRLWRRPRLRIGDAGTIARRRSGNGGHARRAGILARGFRRAGVQLR